MRTTLSLDPDVYEAARTLADASGENLGVVVSALVRNGLTAERDFSAKNGLPIFQVPNDAPIIPGDLAGRLLAEEAT